MTTIRLTAALLALLSVAACNTAEGFVQDAENVGDEIAAEI
ncbi:hypothetical protein BCF33_2607 [Hasllibacter halocynthiae]|uniref:Entericidin EcnA/B family protein n=1 Tax=Hasllibacter halocynthiae TaxID=595589 RepID=A0A2T0X444_9RHOB|nr:entericidin [Hasllibacter halocynthiae]PRY93723.1 hypothetical protein BCF33_2607 [Hasllibacter halocynthiae]